MPFIRMEPPVNEAADISRLSFETIERELRGYEECARFTFRELEVAKRLIHTTSCFSQVLESLHFTENAVERIMKLLSEGALIVTDVNMIKVGLSSFYLQKYGNESVCYVNESFAYERARKDGVTRSYAAVCEAVKRHSDRAMIFACGNAPTFIYAAVNTLIDEGIDPSNCAFILFPVGFVNVVESKEYGLSYAEEFSSAAIALKGRFGGSTSTVAALHAIYRLIEDFDSEGKYNGR